MLIAGYDPDWETRPGRPDPNYRMRPRHELVPVAERREFEDLTGRTFGCLTALGRADSPKGKYSKRGASWRCRCSCSTPDKPVEVVRYGSQLIRGSVKSCGHLARENRAETSPRAAFSFANLTPEKRSELGKLGALARNVSPVRHKLSHEQAVAAGRKGAEARALARLELERGGE